MDKITSDFLFAVRTQNLEKVREFLSLGADPNSKWKDGTPALSKAVYFGNGDLVETLIEAGADLCPRCEFPPAEMAKINRQPEMFGLLLSHGYRFNDYDIFWARTIGDVDLVARMLAERPTPIPPVYDLAEVLGIAGSRFDEVWEGLGQLASTLCSDQWGWHYRDSELLKEEVWIRDAVRYLYHTDGRSHCDLLSSNFGIAVHYRAVPALTGLGLDELRKNLLEFLQVAETVGLNPPASLRDEWWEQYDRIDLELQERIKAAAGGEAVEIDLPATCYCLIESLGAWEELFECRKPPAATGDKPGTNNAQQSDT